MRSPDNTARIWAEWALRLFALAVLVVLLVRAFATPTGGRNVVQGSSASLDANLRAWTLARPDAAHITFDSIPTPSSRDWIAALRHAGTPVTWEGRGIPAVGVSLVRAPDPVASWDLAVAAPRGSHVVIADAVGPLDSVTSAAGGVRLDIPGVDRYVTATMRGATARVAPNDSIALKRVLIEGSAGWETKFTIAALAERGWNVDAVTHVAPGVDVRLGAPARPDTSRYAAVVAVDTSATMIANGAGAYVRAGGGLVTLHDAETVGPDGGSPVVLERRRDGEVRASRVGRGRVIRIGYKDLWRRRMTNEDSVPDPVAAHRAWLANAVSSVAYAPRLLLEQSRADDPAPLAEAIARMGAPSSAIAARSNLVAGIPTALLFALLMTALLLEWFSRRMRGAR